MALRQAYVLLVTTAIASLLLSGWMSGVLGLEGGFTSPAACASASFPPGASVRDFLNLSIFVNPADNEEFFSPANFTIPASTLVEVTIDDYDSGPSQVPAVNTAVCGTVNGTLSYSGSNLSSLANITLAHTMTITNGSYRGFNVPIPAAPGNSGAPAQVSFYVYFSTPGVYRWQCMANCGENQMSVDGKMSGLITVQSW